jgi:hypothetical protein
MGILLLGAILSPTALILLVAFVAVANLGLGYVLGRTFPKSDTETSNDGS